ncbi:MAG: PKD domain-containing protein [Chitinophagaceae bacterium]
MKRINLIYILFACLLSGKAYSQGCPPNLDFEMGDYSGWEYSIGRTDVVNSLNVISLTPGPRVPGRHELITPATAGKDRYGNFPTLCPYGGNYSFKLGNDDIGSQAEGLSYTFMVPPGIDTFTFTFFYAVVFENPQHSNAEQPRFFATAYDVLSGQIIACASYDFVSTSGLPGFEVSKVNNGVLYKNWSPVSIQFAGLTGRQVRLEFKTADCTLGGHFGYAYVDVGTDCSNILATAPYCVEAGSVILNAPYGFASYTWYNNDMSQVIGNLQTLPLTPPPAVNDIFYVDMVPYPGFGCRDTAYAVVKPEPVPDTPVAESNYKYCQFSPINALSARADPGSQLLWYTSASGGIPSEKAPIPSTAAIGSFDFYVSQKRLFGCESFRKKITVVIAPTAVPSFTINDPRQCHDNNQFIFTSTSTNLFNSTYSWDFGDAQGQPTGSGATHTYTNFGGFTVKLKVTNASLCSSEKTAIVNIIPKPIASFSYPAVICEEQTTVNIIDNSNVPQGLSTIRNWWWDINGTMRSASTGAVAPFIPADPGPINVKLVVTTPEGCRSDTTLHTLAVHYKPVALFNYSDPLCNNKSITFKDLSVMPSGSSPEFIRLWDWQFSNAANSPSQHPVRNFPAGLQHAQLIVETNHGCKSEVKLADFMVHRKPEVGITLNDSCTLVDIHYDAIDLTSSVAKWYWDLGNGAQPGNQQFTKYYNEGGDRSFTLYGQTAQGCYDTLFRAFTIYDNKSFAGNDTLVARGQPVQLNANGGTTIKYTWSPPIGLNDPIIENPIATLDKDQLYKLYAISDKGCVRQSDIFIKRYAGPSFHMPTAFTPNRDGKNDEFRIFPVGIKQFTSLAIYNRYGQLIFFTKDYFKGWDGTHNGMPVGSGNFVVIAKAIDYRGSPMMETGNLVLIR